MAFVKLNLQDDAMLMKLLPLYQQYEAEISGEPIADIFPPDEAEENAAYFMAYFGRGITTYVHVVDSEIQGFVGFNIDCEAVPGYADGYHGWGHIAEIYIHMPWRRAGLGRAMVDRAEAELKQLGAEGIYLTDISGNGCFWESLGYVDTGKIEPSEGGRIFEKRPC